MSERWVNMVKGLLANAADSTLEQSARDNYTERAFAIMEKHRIESWMLDSGKSESFSKRPFIIQPPFVEGQSQFADWVCRGSDCRAVFIGDPSELEGCEDIARGSTAFFVYGREQDIDNFATIFPLVYTQALHAMMTVLNPIEAILDVDNFMRRADSFIDGYGEGVYRKLKVAFDEAVKSEPGAELAVIDKDKKLDMGFAEEFGPTTDIVPEIDARMATVGKYMATQADVGRVRVDNETYVAQRKAIG